MRLVIFLLALEDLMLPCFSKRVLGFECPGCGLQRSLAFLARGEFEAAFHMYPAIYAMLSLVVFLTVNSFFKIKYAGIVIKTLMISAVVLILGNFFLKLI